MIPRFQPDSDGLWMGRGHTRLWRNQTGLEEERGLGHAGSEVCTTQPTGGRELKPESQQEAPAHTCLPSVTHVNRPELLL